MRHQSPDPSRHSTAYLCVLLLGACLVPTTSAAQQPVPGGIAPPARPERPYRGLFGGGMGNTAQSLTLEGNLGGGFVENPVAELGAAGPADGPAPKNGAKGTGSATLLYSMSRARLGVNASNVTLFDYYPQLAQHRMLPRLIFSGSVYFLPLQSTRVTFTETFKNLPEFSFSELFDSDPGQAFPVNQDLGMRLDRYTRYGSAVDVSQKFSARTRADVGVSYGHGMIASRAWTIVAFTGNISHNITKGVTLSVGFRDGGQRDEGSTGKGASERHPRINGGVDYNRALSFSRRTTVSFSTGIAGTRDRSLDQTTYHLIGSVRLNREFGQTWLAGVSYSRDVRHIESLGESLFSDSVTGGLQGSFSRRVQFQSRIGQSIGRLGASGNRFDTYFGTIQLSFALTRQFGLGADYTYYRYATKNGTVPIASFGRMNTQSVRTYIQVWVPLVTRTRRP